MYSCSNDGNNAKTAGPSDKIVRHIIIVEKGTMADEVFCFNNNDKLNIAIAAAIEVITKSNIDRQSLQYDQPKKIT